MSINELTDNHDFYFNIVEVYRTSSESSANKKLASGWKLLRTITVCYDPIAFYDHQSVYYILGRPKNVIPNNVE